MIPSKAIFAGIFVGILGLLGFIRLVGGNSPRMVVAASAAQAAPAPAVAQEAAPAAAEDSTTYSGQCTISGAYPESVRQWCTLIERYARENGVDPNLVSAVMLQESAGQPDAYSKSGAVGLMQVMPRDGKASRFQCKNGPCFSDRPSMDELFDPEFNVAYGTRMLADLIQRHGSMREALRAYGPMDVGYYYADLVLGIMQNHP